MSLPPAGGRKARHLLTAAGCGLATFSAVYLMASWLLPSLSGWASGPATLQLFRDALDSLGQLGRFGVALGSAGLLTRWTYRWLAGRAATADVDMDAVIDRLARKVLAGTSANPLRTRLNRPMPLRVWFRSVDSPHGAARAAVMGDDGVSWQAEPIHAHVDHIAQVLDGLPVRQLVVTGEPGAGKSILALLLTHELAGRRQPGEPIPVLLPISSWAPGRESVTAFVAGRLADEYRLSAQAAKQLVTAPVPGSGYRIMMGLAETPHSC